MISSTTTQTELICYHCGDLCPDDSISYDNKLFCCTGCRTVFEILNSGNLCNYYSIEKSPGISQKGKESKKFDYLDDPAVITRLVDFRNDSITSVTFYIPQMHCSSCIWLLENLYKLNPSVSVSKTDFLKKELSVKFFHNSISLKELVELITSIGYEPYISLETTPLNKTNRHNKKLYARFGVAAFCFGNIMLLSFPEYLSIDIHDQFYRKVFMYLNILLSLPVFFYSASEYYISAYKGLKKKIVNIDFPLSLGIIALFGRSLYEILSGSGAGYLDSLGGLLFFLLLGKIFQSKTYESLNFDRSYKSYFPLSVIKKHAGIEQSVSVQKLEPGDRIVIRNNEVIPADSILISKTASIDYSFVTGESVPVEKTGGELIYAGGKQSGSAIELEVIKEVSQSYLTKLWNDDSFSKEDESFFTHFSNKLSKYFTVIILVIAGSSSLLWINSGIIEALNVFTAVLIVACPCALAMSTPFTLGNALRIFGKNKLYLKNTKSVENLSEITNIVFDKTGTLTHSGESDIEVIGEDLNDYNASLIRSLVRNSTHPLSKKIYSFLKPEKIFNVQNYIETANSGIEGICDNRLIKIGSKKFVLNELSEINEPGKGSDVHFSIDGLYYGYFKISNSYRKELNQVIDKLKTSFSLYVLSGDNESEKENLSRYFGNNSRLFFRQTPEQKLNFVKSLQNQGKKVLMLGDGLNDAGALSQSNAGIALTDDIGTFSPACEGILDAESFGKLPSFLWFADICRKIIIASFTISFLYNIVGLSFAVRGMLSPLFAAVLMPLSSISVVVFATAATRFMAKRKAL